MKKVSVKMLFLVVLTTAIVAAINYMVDPALVLRNGEYEASLAEGILAGHNMVVKTNYDERKFQRSVISLMKEVPDGIVLGSSRVMSIPTMSLGLNQGMCHGVSGATVEDILAIIELYHQKGALPKKVFIGVDPWLFNENHGDTRYLEFSNEYNLFAAGTGLALLPKNSVYSQSLRKLEQALSPSYFQESLANIHSRPSLPDVAESISDEFITRLTDATIVYGAAQRNKSEEEVSAGVREIISSGTLYHSNDYSSLSPAIIAQFDKAIAFLQANGAEVVFILSPLHPALYAYIQAEAKYQMILNAETYITTYASEKGIVVIGSVDPAKVKATATDFTDYMHPSRSFMEAMCSSAYQ